MKGELQKRRILGRGKEAFIGVDVHKESWHVTVRVEEEEVFHGSIPSQYHGLQVARSSRAGRANNTRRL